MADWVSGKVTKVEYWTDALFSLYVRAPVHPFTAGQFTKLGLEIDGERVQRAYSYVNAPGNPDLEFYLVTVPEGKLSPRLAALKPGDEVPVVSEAAGFFVLEEVPDCDTLWMLATGTALGPYLSILQEGKDLERFNNLGAGPRRPLRRGPELSAANARTGAALCRQTPYSDGGQPRNRGRLADRPGAVSD